MNKWKKIKVAFVLVLLLAGVGWLIFCSLTPTGAVQPIYDPHLSFGPLEAGSVCADGQGTVFTLSYTGILRYKTEEDAGIISFSANDMLPSEDGLAYRQGQSLYVWANGKKQTVAEEVTSYAWQGNQLLYETYDCIYCEGALLLELPFPIYMIYANSYGVLIEGQGGFYSYSESHGLVKICDGGSSDWAFLLYRDQVYVTGGLETLKRFSLWGDEEAEAIDCGFMTCESTNLIKAVSVGDRLCISISSESWPQFDLPTFCSTFYIDPDSIGIEKIDDEYHPCMVAASDGVYVTKKYSINWTRLAER